VKTVGARRYQIGIAATATALVVGAWGMPRTAFAQQSENRGYVGPAFLDLPGVRGNWKTAPYKHQILVDAHYWQPIASVLPAEARGAGGAARPGTVSDGRRNIDFRNERALFSLPGAPKTGPGILVLGIDHKSPMLSRLMAMCRAKMTVPELGYSVSTERSRTSTEVGKRPPEIPEYVDYKLIGVEFSQCPSAPGAAQQAIVLRFQDIEWKNWSGKLLIDLDLQPAPFMRQASLPGRTRGWVLTWIGLANDVSDDQCQVMADKPSLDSYYTYLSKDEADKERAALASQGGPRYSDGGGMALRGPGRLDVTALPGLVPDPGMPEPKAAVARGFNLDGDDGSKRRHRNFVSTDGKTRGIDNQLYAATGCIPGLLGRKGFILQFANNQMRDGGMTIVMEMSGIDDDRNDDQVMLSFYYSDDPMAKNAAGSNILHDYSFNKSLKSELRNAAFRVRAKIVDGSIVADSLDEFRLRLSYNQQPPNLKLSRARLRFDIAEDGSLKGLIGGYRDWLDIASQTKSSFVESLNRFQVPALYYALRRNADGLWNPVTRQFEGISSAYDIEGVPAFVTDPDTGSIVADSQRPSTGSSIK
jgi:hypothetical protein